MIRVWRTFAGLPPGFHLLVAALAVALVVVVSACAAAQPAPPDPPRVQGLPEDVWTFCDHGHRVYVGRISGDIALAVVPIDPVCAAGAR